MISGIDSTVPLRVQVRDLLVLHRGGRHEEALDGAVKLAEKFRCSALAQNLIGDLQIQACLRHRDSDSEAARKHGQCAVDAYKLATAAAPNCLKTSSSYIASLCQGQIKLYEDAEEEIYRVEQQVTLVDDPQIHHVCFDLDGNRTREERIKSAKDEFCFQKGKFQADRENNEIEQVLLMLQSMGAKCAVAAAEKIADKYPTSAPIQHLLVYLKTEVVGTLSPDDQIRKDVMQTAVEDMRELSSTFPNSLVISHYYAKLLLLTGSYSAADTECRRALSIEIPEPLEYHQMTFGLSSVESGRDKIAAAMTDIAVLQKLVSTQLNWSFMTAHQQEMLKSVKVETLIKRFSIQSELISNAVKSFKASNSWRLYICPSLAASCRGYWNRDAVEFRRHMVMFHLQCSPKITSASTEETTAGQEGLWSAISLCQDSEQDDVIKFRSFDQMYQCILLVSAKELPSIESMQLKLGREVSGILEGLTTPPGIEQKENSEKLWIKLLEACTHDFRVALMPLVSLFKLEELQNWGGVNSYSLDEFDWTFSGGKEELNKSNASSFGFLGCSDRTQEEEKNNHLPSFDLLGDFCPISEPGPISDTKILSSTKIQKEEEKNNHLPSFDLLGDFCPISEPGPISDTKILSSTKIQKEELDKTYQPTFDLLGDVDITNPIEYKPSSVDYLENLEKDEKRRSFDPLDSLGWGTLIEQSPKSSDGDTHKRDSYEQKKIIEQTSKDQLKKKDGQKSKGKGRGQAVRYGTSRLFRPEKIEATPAGINKDLREEFDPYGFDFVHKQYLKDLRRASHHLCSVCYFEKCHDLEVKDELVHYTKVHGACGFKCDSCPARFLLQSALEFHRKICHEEKQPG